MFLFFLNKMGEDKESVSRRIGLLIFGKDYNHVEGSGPSLENKRKGTKLLQAVRDLGKEGFSKLILDETVRQWLKAGHNDMYRRLCEEFKQQASDGDLVQFFKGQKHNQNATAQRGIAIRLAWLEAGLAHYLEEDELLVEEILEAAGEHLHKIRELNQESFQNLQAITDAQIDRLREERIKRIKQQYIRILVETVISYYEKADQPDMAIPLTRLGDTIKAVISKHDLSDTYDSPSRLRQELDSKVGKVNQILDTFGLRYQGEGVVLIKAPKRLRRYTDEDEEGKMEGKAETSHINDETTSTDGLPSSPSLPSFLSNWKDWDITVERDGRAVIPEEDLVQEIRDGMDISEESAKQKIGKLEQEGKLMEMRPGEYIVDL